MKKGTRILDSLELFFVVYFQWFQYGEIRSKIRSCEEYKVTGAHSLGLMRKCVVG